MGKLLKSVHDTFDEANYKPNQPNSLDDYAQPWIIDISEENISYTNPKTSYKKHVESEQEAPSWFKDLKSDFEAEDEQYPPSGRPYAFKKSSSTSIRPNKNKTFKKYFLICFSVALAAIGALYSFSSSNKGVISLPSQEHAIDFLKDNNAMNEEELKTALIKFIETFYFDQSANNFDVTAYFADNTEVYYEDHDLSSKSLRNVHNKRLRGMYNLKQDWVLSSLDFYKNGSEIILTYWVELSYLKRSYNKQEAANVKNEMIINENGRIISLRQLKMKNFSSVYIKNEHDDFNSVTRSFPQHLASENPFKSDFSLSSVLNSTLASSSDKERTVLNLTSSQQPATAINTKSIAQSMALNTVVLETPTPVMIPPTSAKVEEIAETGGEDKLYDYNSAEYLAEFPGGLKQLSKFISFNIRYPEKAFEDGIHGKVFVSFIVEKTGNLTELKVIKGIGGGCDEETLRILRKSPLWKPGSVLGKPVRSRFAFPVVFKIAN